MIAKSDLVILVISAGALAVGLYRWQQNVARSEAGATAPAVVLERGRASPAPPTPSTAPADNPSTAPADTADSTAPTASTGSSGPPARPEPTRPAVDAPRDPPTRTGRPAGDDATAGDERRTADAAAPRGTAPPDRVDEGADDGADAAAGAPAEGTGTLAAGTADDAAEPYGVYRVRGGDYLGLIAERFGTTVATLRRLNGLEGNLIYVGQQIRYPVPAN